MMFCVEIRSIASEAVDFPSRGRGEQVLPTESDAQERESEDDNDSNESESEDGGDIN